MMTTPLDAKHRRCLAYPHPSHPIPAPRDWCPLRYQCARHQTITVDVFDGRLKILPRVCASDTAEFLPADEASA